MAKTFFHPIPVNTFYIPTYSTKMSFSNNNVCLLEQLFTVYTFSVFNMKLTKKKNGKI